MVMYNRLLQHKIRTALVYADTKTITPGAGATWHSFSLNSIFDPDVSGLGHQPAYHDKWAALYGVYRVVRTSWSITFSPMRAHNSIQVVSGGTATGETHAVSDSNHHDILHNPGIVAYEVSDDLIPKQIQSVDKNVIREASGGKRNVRYKMTSGAPYARYHLRGSMTPKQYLDAPTNANTATVQGANPAQNGYLHVGALSKDGNVMSAYRFDIRLTYVVEYTDPGVVEEEN